MFCDTAPARRLLLHLRYLAPQTMDCIHTIFPTYLFHDFACSCRGVLDYRLIQPVTRLKAISHQETFSFVPGSGMVSYSSCPKWYIFGIV